jgi:hypothetical protein
MSKPCKEAKEEQQITKLWAFQMLVMLPTYNLNHSMMNQSTRKPTLNENDLTCQKMSTFQAVMVGLQEEPGLHKRQHKHLQALENCPCKDQETSWIENIFSFREIVP